MPDLPPPLMTSEPGSFARATIVERKPKIIAQVMADTPYPPDILAALESFSREIASQPLRPLQEDLPADVVGGVNGNVWHEAASAYAGRSWLELPWYFAETFFYRRLLEAVRYFQPGDWQGVDPFQRQKDRQIAADIRRAALEWEQPEGIPPHELCAGLLHSCLWGNRTDLSNFTVKLQGKSGLAARQESANVLIDHTEQICQRLAAGCARLDWINDNCGIDFLTDLALTDFLLGQGWVQTIVMHLKPQPFFVSDAMVKDALATIAALQKPGDPAAPHLAQLGARLQASLDSGRLRFASDPFWAAPLMFRQMPLALRQELAQASLVLLKGDVNYRRLLDDCHWPHTTPLEAIAGYFPAPFVTLRTLKGEIIAGLAPQQVADISAADPTWLINGQRGLIQLVDAPESASSRGAAAPPPDPNFS